MKSDPPIAVSDSGFCFGNLVVDWVEIKEIVAFKLDLVTWDEVRFAFRTSEKHDDLWIEISEDQPGFKVLLGELIKRFPSVRGWEERVVKPAFATNRTRLFISEWSDSAASGR